MSAMETSLRGERERKRELGNGCGGFHTTEVGLWSRGGESSSSTILSSSLIRKREKATDLLWRNVGGRQGANFKEVLRIDDGNSFLPLD